MNAEMTIGAIRQNERPSTSGASVTGASSPVSNANSGVGEYGRRLAGETRTSLESLQRSLAVMDGVSAPLDLPAGVSLRYGYQVGEVGLLHDPAAEVQLTESPKLFGLPNTRVWCRGLANLRGNLIPVYDLAALVGGPTPRRRNKLMVVGTGANAAALVIDATPLQVRINVDQPESDHTAVPEVLQGHLRNLYRTDDRLWIDPDYDSLFKKLAELAEI